MEAPFNRDKAHSLGWTFEQQGQKVTWFRNGREAGQTEGSFPLFFALAAVAEIEGMGFLKGYGGDGEATGELIEAVSGETGSHD